MPKFLSALPGSTVMLVELRLLALLVIHDGDLHHCVTDVLLLFNFLALLKQHGSMWLPMLMSK